MGAKTPLINVINCVIVATNLVALGGQVGRASAMLASEMQLPVLGAARGKWHSRKVLFSLPRAPGQPKIDHLRRLHLGAYPTEECKSCTR